MDSVGISVLIIVACVLTSFFTAVNVKGSTAEIFVKRIAKSCMQGTDVVYDTEYGKITMKCVGVDGKK